MTEYTPPPPPQPLWKLAIVPAIVLAFIGFGAFAQSITGGGGGGSSAITGGSCSAGQFATAVGTDGAPTCSTITGTALPTQQRITLSPSNPIMNVSVAGSTTVYVTPYNGTNVQIYNGTSFVSTAFAETSQATTDATKSPTAVGASAIYDIFCWIDAGTNRCTRGPAWTSSHVRGTGAGSSQLTRIGGILLNAVNITNGPAAERGTYMGSIASNASSTIDYILGGSASGGTAGRLAVWNNFNRTATTATVVDSGITYTLTPASFRQARASAGNQVTFLTGGLNDAVTASYTTRITTTNAPASYGVYCIGHDTTTACTNGRQYVYTPTTAAQLGSPTMTINEQAELGLHVFSANEASDGTNAAQFDGDNNATLTVTVWN
jgi:hypothetical protein